MCVFVDYLCVRVHVCCNSFALALFVSDTVTVPLIKIHVGHVLTLVLLVSFPHPSSLEVQDVQWSETLKQWRAH